MGSGRRIGENSWGASQWAEIQHLSAVARLYSSEVWRTFLPWVVHKDSLWWFCFHFCRMPHFLVQSCLCLLVFYFKHHGALLYSFSDSSLHFQDYWFWKWQHATELQPYMRYVSPCSWLASLWLTHGCQEANSIVIFSFWGVYAHIGIFSNLLKTQDKEIWTCSQNSGIEPCPQ